MPCRQRTFRELYKDAVALLGLERLRHATTRAALLRWRRLCRLATGLALALLLTPGRVGVPEAGPRLAHTPEAVGIHPPPPDALGRSQPLPEVFPENWQRGNCPRRPTRRLIRGVCFVVLAEKPPCEDGYEEAGECVSPIIAPAPVPNALGR